MQLFYGYTTQNGLPSYNIMQLLGDTHGILWLGTPNQIASLAQDTKLAACWFVGFYFQPCFMAGENGQASTFVQLPVGWL